MRVDILLIVVIFRIGLSSPWWLPTPCSAARGFSFKQSDPFSLGSRLVSHLYFFSPLSPNFGLAKYCETMLCSSLIRKISNVCIGQFSNQTNIMYAGQFSTCILCGIIRGSLSMERGVRIGIFVGSTAVNKQTCLLTADSSCNETSLII